ncbi:MAG: hypothetical protein OEZ59_13760 [Deltaproteobacteria bacterium]|nr:hypothetical protein [Deltaproteobacteria bacterium]
MKDLILEKMLKATLILGGIILMAVGAGPTQAAEVSGELTVAFGRLTLDDGTDTYNHMIAAHSAELVVAAESNEFSAKVAFQSEDTVDLTAVPYQFVIDQTMLAHELVWKASPELSVTLSAINLGVASLDAFSDKAHFHGYIALGLAEPEEDGLGMMNLEYSMDKSTQVGLAIFTDCVITCDLGAIVPDAERETMLFHGRMDSPDFQVNGAYAKSSGVAVGGGAGGGDATVESSGIKLGLGMKTGGMDIGVDFVSATVAHPDPVTNVTEDMSITALSAGLEVNNIAVVYYSGSISSLDGVVDDNASVSSIVAGYAVPAGKLGKVGGEYRTETTKISSGGVSASTTDTSIMFGMSSSF